MSFLCIAQSYLVRNVQLQVSYIDEAGQSVYKLAGHFNLSSFYFVCNINVYITHIPHMPIALLKWGSFVKMCAI